MKTLNLRYTPVTTKGRFMPSQPCGGIYINSNLGEIKNNNQIAVQINDGYNGDTRDNALINITFETGEIWSGTFDKLREKLLK